MSAHPDLGTLQRWMARIVRHPDGANAALAEDATRALIPAAAIDAGDVVRPTPELSVARRLDIYNDGYFVRLPEAIGEDFPGLEHALGADAYRALLRDYLVAEPSRHPNLIFASRAMPAYVGARRDLPDHALLGDLAAFEWAVIEAFHARRAEALDPNTFAHWTPDDWARHGLELAPSVHLATYRYPVHDYVAALNAGREPTRPAPRDVAVCIHRHGDRAVWTELEPRAHDVLSSIAAGDTLAIALERAGDDADRIGTWFQDWSSRGLFVGTR